MSDESRVQVLLDHAMDSGRTPEDVCGDSPDLLPAVRRRWERCRQIEEELDALFPASLPVAAARPGLSDLPQVAGYAVEAVLGRGGMGVVFRAQHLRLNRTVALKMLRAGEHASRSERARFLREARASAGLRHPHLVQIHDVGEADGRPYFTMEFVEGGTLAERLRGIPQPATAATDLTITLAEAVEAAHRGGVIHRDLKPGNVLLTAGGAPKVGDFGLARQVQDTDQLTLSGDRLGTPSYMAPEQAGGRLAAVGPATDVYALGAILYEMLTGRPPFHGESSADTERQVLTVDPVPPSRLNPRVPRDLETICLKCLQKDPARRYASAAALAGDLGRCRRGEPILARPVGQLERSAKWVRRHPATVTVLASAAALAITLGASGLWLVSQRASVAQAVGNDLREAVWLQRQSSWGTAEAALDRARARLGDHWLPALRDRLNQGDQDEALAAQLDTIGLGRVVVEGSHHTSPLTNAQADVAYGAALRDAGMGDFGNDPSVVAARVTASNACAAIVVALDDCAVCTTDPRRREWLLAVARKADPDPTGWRDRARDPVRWLDPAVIANLARTAFDAHAPIRLLVAIGERLQASGGDAIPFLERVQRENPGDFWANFTLADAYWQRDVYGEAIRYYQAALAVRPNAPVAQSNLGMALAAAGMQDDAIFHFRQAIALDPGFGHAHYSLGLSLKGEHQLPEALAQLLRAQQIDPSVPDTAYNVGLALNELGRPGEAIVQFRTALRLRPGDLNARYNLGLSLRSVGRAGEAIVELRQVIARAPDMADAHYNLGLAFKDAHRRAEAIAQFQETVRINPRYASAHGTLGQLLLERGSLAAARDALVRCLDLLPPSDPDRPRYLGMLAESNAEIAEARAARTTMSLSAPPVVQAGR